MLWLTVIVFVGLLLVLVLAHEWGHFWAAKKAGCRVEEFAFGFPPRLFSFVKGETRYSFNLLPLGGYVKIEGEDNNENHGPRSFASKSVPWRILILAAGVLMNVVLAAVLLSWQAGVGVPTLVTDENRAIMTDIKTFVVDVRPNSPAEQIGLKPLDRVVRIGEATDPTVEDVVSLVAAQAGQEVTLEIERQGIHETLAAVPRVNPPDGEGALGIALQATGLEKAPWYTAPWVGVKRTGVMLTAIVSQFGVVFQRLVSQESVGDILTGPVGIAVYTNEVTNLGMAYVLEFGALISLNLALVNILPIPALDGGRILFVLVEAIFRRRVPARLEAVSHMTGFALLILLLVFITVKDVGRFL